jgi:hypothetical protein
MFGVYGEARYCIGLTEEPGEPIPDGTNFWLFINDEQDRFLDTARDELGFSQLSEGS